MSKPRPEDLIPDPCIKLAGTRRAYCGRELEESKVFYFTEAGYALEHYENGKILRACKACCGQVRAEIIKGNLPYALRSMK